MHEFFSACATKYDKFRYLLAEPLHIADLWFLRRFLKN